MLSTVRMLRRLFRNAFLVTNRVRVMAELRGKQETDRRRWVRSTPIRIDDSVPYRQPCRDWRSKAWMPRQSAISVTSLYFPGPAPPTSGDRHRRRVTNVTPNRTSTSKTVENALKLRRALGHVVEGISFVNLRALRG